MNSLSEGGDQINWNFESIIASFVVAIVYEGVGKHAKTIFVMVLVLTGGGSRMSCVVCFDDQPCLFDVVADLGETNNLAKRMPQSIVLRR